MDTSAAWRSLITDSNGWRRVIFQQRRFNAAFQRLDDTFVNYVATINMTEKSLTLAKPADKSWKTDFTFEQPDAEKLTLDGGIDHHAIRMHRQLFDRKRFLLVSRGFQWVQEYLFNG